MKQKDSTIFVKSRVSSVPWIGQRMAAKFKNATHATTIIERLNAYLSRLSELGNRLRYVYVSIIRDC